MEYSSPIKRKHEENEIKDAVTPIPITIDNNNESTVVKKQKTKKNVRFDDVTVYYFARNQGFVSVPSQGTVTLGMAHEHSHVEQYSVTDFSRLRRSVHKAILRERKLLPPSTTSIHLQQRLSPYNQDDAYVLGIDSDNDEEEPLPVDDYYFVQPIATRQRRLLLRQAGLVKIDATEKHELTLIRRSREVCGCSCTRETGGCQPLTCECYLNGIACQVDRLTFPCPCATMLCKNPFGRLEFNQSRVRNHYFQTLNRLTAEKNQELFEGSLIDQDESDDQSIVSNLMSFMITQIESEFDEILSVLDSLISSIDNPTVVIEESSTFSSINLPCDSDISVSTTMPVSSKDYRVQTQRVCHNNPSKLSIRRKLITSTTLMSTEL